MPSNSNSNNTSTRQQGGGGGGGGGGGVVSQRWQALKHTLERSMNKSVSRNDSVPSSPGSSSCHTTMTTESDNPPKPKMVTIVEPARHGSQSLDDNKDTEMMDEDDDEDDDDASTVVTSMSPTPTVVVMRPPSYARILAQRLLEERTRAAILAEHEATLLARGEIPRRMTWEEVEAALQTRLRLIKEQQEQDNDKNKNDKNKNDNDDHDDNNDQSEEGTGKGGIHVEEFLFDESVYHLFFGTNDPQSTPKTVPKTPEVDDDDDDDATRHQVEVDDYYDDDVVEPGCDYVTCQSINPWTFLVEELTGSSHYQAVEEFVVTLEHRATEDVIDSHNATKQFFSAMCSGSEGIPTE